MTCNADVAFREQKTHSIGIVVILGCRSRNYDKQNDEKPTCGNDTDCDLEIIFSFPEPDHDKGVKGDCLFSARDRTFCEDEASDIADVLPLFTYHRRECNSSLTRLLDRT